MIAKFISCLAVPLLLLGATLATGCKRNDFRQTQGLIWNTSYHITYAGAPELEDSIAAVLNELNHSLNVFDTTSLVSRANTADTIITDQHFRKVYKCSEKIHKASGGAFDPTLSPLIAAWGFGPGHKATADTMRIAEILSYTGLDKTHMEGDTLIKDDRRTSFNFSAIAKGYACDAVAAMLRRNEVTSYLVEIGGEIAMAGISPSRDQWKVSVDRPVENDSAIVHDATAVIQITDAGMATSGNYRNYRKENGRTLGHTISPKTGRPISTDVISATVIAPTAMQADAAATACMAAGSEKAKEMISELRYECLLILEDSTTWATAGLQKFLQ